MGKVQVKPTFIDLRSTNTQAILLTADRQLFSFDLAASQKLLTDDAKPRLTFLKKFSNIEKIAAGPGYFLVLKKVIRPAFEQWTPEMVYEWIAQTPLDFVKNVIKYSKIDGKTLLNATDEFYENTLGIADESWTYKLKHLITSLREECITEVTLYGWGDNTWGQLGVYGPLKVYQPVEIDLPTCFKVTKEQVDK